MSCVDEVKDVLQEHNILPSSTIESEGEVHAICTALFSTDKLDEVFFEVFTPLAQLYSGNPSQISKVLERIARTCNAKEVFLNISEALSLPKDDMPIETAIYLFTLVQIVLLRLKERRAAFLKSCIPLLTHIFDRVAQPDDSEESEDEEEGQSSFQILGEETNSHTATVSEELISRVLNAMLNVVLEMSATLSLYDKNEQEAQKCILLSHMFLLLAKPAVISRDVDAEPSTIMRIIGKLGLDIAALLKYSEHTIPRNIAPQSESDSGSGSDSDEEDSSQPTNSLLSPNQPYAGIAYFFYLLLVKQKEPQLWPGIIAPQYTFDHILPYISGLLLDPLQRTSSVALELHAHLLPQIPLYTIVTPPCTHNEWAMITRAHLSINHHFLFLQALLNWLVQCPDEQLRKQGHAQLKGTIALFCASSRFSLYENLLKTSPYPQVNSVLIHCIKEEVEKAYYGDSPDPEATLFFAGPKLLDLLPIFMNKSDDMMNHMDQVVAALNFYRYILIKDRARKSIGVCARSNVISVKEAYVLPLKTRTRELLHSFQLLERNDPESLRQQEEAAKMLGLSPLTPDENRQSAALATTSLLLLDDLISRVEELLLANENE